MIRIATWKEGLRARIRVLMKHILGAYGCPPDEQDAVVRAILAKASMAWTAVGRVSLASARAWMHSPWSGPALAIAVAIGCALIAWLSRGGMIVTALAIFFASVIGFHLVALMSYRAKSAWLVLDYSLEVVTVTSLLAAVAGIQQSARVEVLQAEFAKHKAEQSSLLYAMKTVIENDCHPKPSRKDMWTPSPPPYEGACDRIEHFLPQVEYTFGKETGIENMTSNDMWATNLLINESDAKGAWAGLYGAAHRYIDGCRRTQLVVDEQKAFHSDVVAALASSGKLHYWQFLLAFVLGVKLARRTAGVLVGLQTLPTGGRPTEQGIR